MLRSEVQHAIKNLKASLEVENSRASASRGAKMHAIPHIDVPALIESLAETEAHGLNVAVALAILDSLKFQQMNFRHSKIQESHPQTFEWAFSNNFSTWLRSSERLFWISGKPGSGKSTLMKYLVENPETRRILSSSIQNESCRMVIASYFFWINGTEMQRSQEGLLQSLLYEFLRQCPALVETILPDLWKRMSAVANGGKHAEVSWKPEELLESFRRLSTLDTSGVHLCVFIDGLDEYLGDHDELIETIRCLMAMNVKTCVASRPWNLFEEAFGEEDSFKIYLQQLNEPDIRRYADDKLRSRRGLQSGQIHVATIDGIINDIVKKSQGVFLWVFLVVRSLVEGLRNDDRLSQLRKRLDAFPADLHEFFRHIFQSLDPTYRIQTAHMFQVALAASCSLSTLAYWFLDEEEDQPGLALTMPVTPISNHDLDERKKRMQIRINGRCKGLLEVTPNFRSSDDYRVDFLHRTVADFFMTTDMQQVFPAWQADGFDAYFAICKVTLAECKSVETPISVNLDDIVDPFFRAAKHIEVTKGYSLVEYIDEMHRVLLAWHRVHPQSVLDHLWGSWGFVDGPLPSMAISYDLLIYVESKLKKEGYTGYLLNKNRILHRCFRVSTLSGIDMLHLVIRYGPHVFITNTHQMRIVRPFKHLTREQTMFFLGEICKNATFEVETDTFASRDFDAQIAKKLSREEIRKILKGHSYQQNGSDGADDDNYPRPQLATKTNVNQKSVRQRIFRKIFRSTQQ